MLRFFEACLFAFYRISSPPGVPADLNPARHSIKSPARRSIKSPARRPGGFAIRRKKRFDLLNRGICNPPTKGNVFSFAADSKSAEPK